MGVMAGEFRIARDMDRCIVCQECIRVCPQSQRGEKYPVFAESTHKDSPPEIVHIDNCIQCLRCVNTCRAMALIFDNYRKVERLVVDKYLIWEAKKII
jgi:NAD-dependent dihydropyrimidine dehydrogenase PreA subunit